MADFINTVDLLGDKVVADSILDRSITEFKDDTVTVIGQGAFYHAAKLTIVDVPSVTQIYGQAFYGAGNLTALILRSETMCKLGSTNAFTSSKVRYYVPSALISEYRVETNWSSSPADSFRALEDYTVDGTIYGDLDESKI